MNAHVEAPRREHPLARLTRAVEGTIPNPLLALPPLLLALGLLSIAPARIASDTWFGLAAGRDIARAGLPHSDRLTVFTGGQPWQDQQWLAHLTTYGLFDLGGLPLVYLVDVACLVGALSLAMLAARRLGGSPMWIAALATPLILDPGSVGGARADLRDAALRGARVAARARCAHPGPQDPARHPAARGVGERPRERAARVRARAAALRGGRRPGASRSRSARTRATRRDRVRGARRAVRIAVRLRPARLLPGDADERCAFRSIVSEWGATTLRGWFGPLFFAFAAVAIVAILRPGDPAPPVRQPVPRGTRARRPRRAAQRRLAAVRRRGAAAGRVRRVVAGVAGALAAAAVARVGGGRRRDRRRACSLGG